MKNHIYLTALMGAALAFSACSNEEDMLFDDTAADRLNGASALYSARLMAQPNGWAVQLYPTHKNEAPFGNGYLLLMDFNDDYSVKVSMNNALTGGNYKSATSAWQVITDNGPVLSFNTYNDVLHTFSYPEDVAGTSDNETGTGIGGDYEFVIVDAPEDASYMMLKGKKRGTYNLLTPVEEGVDYEAYLTDVKAFQAKMFPENAVSGAIIHYGDSLCNFEDAGDGIPTIYPVGGDAVTQSQFNPFLITKRGEDYFLRFRDAKEFGDVTVQDYRYDVEKDIFESVDNADFYICGEDPTEFFGEAITSYTFSLNRGTEMSDDVAAAIETVYETYREVNAQYGPREYKMMVNSKGQLAISAAYNPKNEVKTKLTYLFDIKREGDVYTFQYVEAGDATSGNHYERMKPALDAIFSDSFTISAYTTEFDLSSLRLTSTSNPEKWFYIQTKSSQSINQQ